MRLHRTLVFEARGKWDHETGGVANLGAYDVYFDTPREFNGKGGSPCPDQLFLASLSGCVITTFNYFKKLHGADPKDVEAYVSGRVERGKEGYRLSSIYIKLTVVSSLEGLEVNKMCAKKALQYCHLTKSIEPAIPIEASFEVVVG